MRKPNTQCPICSSEYYSTPSRPKKTCSRECMGESKIRESIRAVEDRLEIDSMEDYLYESYIVKRMSTREISVLAFGKPTSFSTINRWLDRYDIPIRQGSEAIKTQWENNPERRKAQSEWNKNFFTFEQRSETMKKTWENPEFIFTMTVGRTGENNPMYGVYGEEHPQWNPDLTDEEREHGRKVSKYSTWRRAVLKRDNHTCQVCKDNKTDRLIAHHLNGWNWSLEERDKVENGVTLCEDCHLDFHSQYGYGDNTEEQYEEYVKQLIKI